MLLKELCLKVSRAEFFWETLTVMKLSSFGKLFSARDYKYELIVKENIYDYLIIYFPFLSL